VCSSVVQLVLQLQLQLSLQLLSSDQFSCSAGVAGQMQLPLILPFPLLVGPFKSARIDLIYVEWSCLLDGFCLLGMSNACD
jgi:hypothetical protein